MKTILGVLSHFSSFHAAAIIFTATLVLPVAQAAGQTGDRVVYYQVSYKNGDVRDLDNVPDTNEGIIRVVRMMRVDNNPSGEGYEEISTGEVAHVSVEAAETYRNELKWNGKAWLAPEDIEAAKNAESADDSALVKREIAKTRKILEKLKASLREHDAAVGAAQRQYENAKGADDEDNKAAALKKAQAAQKAVADSVSLYENHIKALNEILSPDKLPKATGEIGLSDDAPGKTKDAMGIASPMTDTCAPSHRVQVWKLPEGEGRRTYNVTIAHPEAGSLGAFYYVAYADTDGDGKPDKLIARSPLAQVNRAGEWSKWSFTTDYKTVFAGNAWPSSETAVYNHPVTEAEDPGENWQGLPKEIYISDLLWGKPDRHPKYYACLSNIRVNLDNNNSGNPDKMSGSKGSHIVIE